MNNELKDFINQLGIKGDFVPTSNGVYKLDINTSDEFFSIYSLLEKSDAVEEINDSSQVTVNNASVQYSNSDYLVTLLGDLVANSYSMTVKELEKRN